MKKERSGRAKTVPSRLGSLESSGACAEVQAGSGPFSQSVSVCPEQAASHHNTLAHSAPHPHTPSTLKKTVHLLSPEVLTNWYTNRKRDNLYGPRRNSISNLFFNPDKKASSPLLSELRNGDKLRNSMLNLDHILLGEGVEPRHLTNGKGIVRSESAKLTTNEGKSEVKVWETFETH